MSERPFTPATLAERWECSQEHIMAMCRKGILRAFRIGPKLWRIPANEVARWETGEAIQSRSADTEGSSAPSSAAGADVSASRSARQIRSLRGPVLLSSDSSASD